MIQLKKYDFFWNLIKRNVYNMIKIEFYLINIEFYIQIIEILL